ASSRGRFAGRAHSRDKVLRDNGRIGNRRANHHEVGPMFKGAGGLRRGPDAPLGKDRHVHFTGKGLDKREVWFLPPWTRQGVAAQRRAHGAGPGGGGSPSFLER